MSTLLKCKRDSTRFEKKRLKGMQNSFNFFHSGVTDMLISDL